MNRERLVRIGTVLLMVVAGVGATSEHVPSAPNSAVDVATHLRAFWRVDRWNPMVGLEVRSEDGFTDLYRSFTAGSYYRIHRNLKVGAFYRLQQATRHDDDWIARDGSFEWNDTNDRMEHVFIADASPRFLFPWLPGENWVFMLKSRYAYNIYNTHQWVQLRPGLTYFHIVDRQPRLNASVQWEFYLPVNFGEALLYAHWPYLNLLYHLTPTVKLDASVARRTQTWSTSQDVADDPAHSDYTKTVQNWVVGLGVILQLEP